MPILARRYVELDIAQLPTLDEMIRGITGPYGGSGTSSVEIPIPSYVQAGDLMLILSGNTNERTIVHEDATNEGFYIVAYHSDWNSDADQGWTEADDETAVSASHGQTCTILKRIATGSEPASYTVDYMRVHYPSTDPRTYDGTHVCDNIVYLMVMDGSKISNTEAGSASGETNYHYIQIEGGIPVDYYATPSTSIPDVYSIYSDVSNGLGVYCAIADTGASANFSFPWSKIAGGSIGLLSNHVAVRILPVAYQGYGVTVSFSPTVDNVVLGTGMKP